METIIMILVLGGAALASFGPMLLLALAALVLMLSN